MNYYSLPRTRKITCPLCQAKLVTQSRSRKYCEPCGKKMKQAHGRAKT